MGKRHPTHRSIDVRNTCDFAIIPRPRSVEVVSDVPPQSLNPTVMSRLGERPVVRSPQQLRLHRALEELGWTGMIDKFNEATRQTNAFVPEPILITKDGTILAGFGRRQLAVFEGRREIFCIECALDENDSLQFILTHHQIRWGWNDLVRIRLALTMKSSLREKALENMRAGGKYKGLANLPEGEVFANRSRTICNHNISRMKALTPPARKKESSPKPGRWRL